MKVRFLLRYAGLVMELNDVQGRLRWPMCHVSNIELLAAIYKKWKATSLQGDDGFV
jgi:hypothetical protein